MSTILLPATLAQTVEQPPQTTSRNVGIDWLRGVVMVLMALDHVRDFFTDVPYPPETMARTTLALFLTRWVTHFCAPVFFFLAGTSAYLNRERAVGTLYGFLARRGLMLIVLELTVIGYAWSFMPGSSFAGVLWALGWSMLLLALLIRARPWVVGMIGAVLVAGHNLLDAVPASAFGELEWLWRVLHVKGPTATPFGFEYFILYPLVPWVGVMALGYAAGTLLESKSASYRVLAAIGVAAIIAFVLLRLTNVYGNPVTPSINGAVGHFEVQDTRARTLIAFLNTEKYPASLQYLLMTLGPTLIALAIAGWGFSIRAPGRINRAIILFGRVALFYYLCHLYLIHGLERVISAAAGGQARFGLPMIYLLWAVVCIALYLPCRWYMELKQRRSTWIFRYV